MCNKSFQRRSKPSDDFYDRLGLCLKAGIMIIALAGVAQLARESLCAPKGCEFNSGSGHIYRLQVRSLLGVCMGGN